MILHIVVYTVHYAGAYCPLVLAPVEGMGVLRAPCQVWVIFILILLLFFILFFILFILFFNFFLTFFTFIFIFFYFFFIFLLFLLFLFIIIIIIFFFFFTFFFLLFTTHFTTNHYQYCHPPPPTQRFLYLRETQANVLRGLQRFWGGCKDLATISEWTDNSVLGFWYMFVK